MQTEGVFSSKCCCWVSQFEQISKKSEKAKISISWCYVKILRKIKASGSTSAFKCPLQDELLLLTLVSLCLYKVKEKEVRNTSGCLDMNLICILSLTHTSCVHAVLLEAEVWGSCSLLPPLHLVSRDKRLSSNL